MNRAATLPIRRLTWGFVSWSVVLVDPVALAATHTAALAAPLEIDANLLEAVGDEHVEDLGMGLVHGVSFRDGSLAQGA